MSRIQSAAALRRLHKNISTAITMTAGADPSAAIVTVPGSKYTIFVQRVVVLITTDAAPTLTFRDSAGTPVPFSGTPASPGVGSFILLDVEEGLPLTQGTNLMLAASAAGLAGRIIVEGYAKLTGTAVPSDI